MAKWRRVEECDLPEFYAAALPTMRTAARSLGYALAVHGSLKRDFDIIAVPWIPDPADRDVLAKAVQCAVCGMYSQSVKWEKKLHGRSATMLPVCLVDGEKQGLGHIDLSVMQSFEET